MSSISRNALLMTATLALAACSSSDDGSGNNQVNQPPDPHAALNAVDTTGAPDGIVDLPASVPALVTDLFARYSHVTIPIAGRIHFLAQAGISDEAHFRARKVLEQHLADFAGSTFGANKTAIREAIAASGGTFVLFLDEASADASLPAVIAFAAEFPGYGQLFATEAIVEGSPEYMLPSPALDSTLSATGRFVLHAGGAAMAGFRGELATRSAAAQAASIYMPAPGSQDVDGDFLARTLEVYYGVWGHDPRGDGRAGVDDTYAFHTRATLEAGDPATATLLATFFAPVHSYPAFLTAAFTATFDSRFDPVLPYTHRSRYLTRIGIRSAQGARINGNDLDGVYQGSTGDDQFEARGGNDLIEGASTLDLDRAFFTGASTEYLISPSPFGGGATQVQDLVPNRDGIDQVRFVEELVFTDMTIPL